MAYILIEDFKAGIDRRRPMSAAHQGTLYELINAHITPGGDIEKRKAFVPYAVLPAGTHGLAATPTGLMVFGSDDAPAGMPGGVRYRRLEPTVAGAALERVLDVESFGDGEYAIGQFSAGLVAHYYKGERVTAWDSIMSDTSDNAGVAAKLATEINAGGVFTAEADGARITVTDYTTRADFARSASTDGAVDGQDIVETLVITSPYDGLGGSCSFVAPDNLFYSQNKKAQRLTVDDTQLLASAVDLDFGSSAADNAIKIAASVNAATANHGFSATATGDNVVLQAPVGEQWNDEDVTLTIRTGIYPEPKDRDSVVGTFSGGYDPRPSGLPIQVVFTVTGTFSPLVSYHLTLEEQTYSVLSGQSGAGQVALTHGGKVYSAASSLLFFSGFNATTSQPDPTRWHESPDTIGAGFIDMTMQSGGVDRLVALGIYQGLLAVFSARSTYLWRMNADPLLNESVQTLGNIGTIAPASVAPYGDHDLFFLSSTGVRSLRARDSSNTASSVDIGTPIDREIKAQLAAMPEADRAKAIAAIDPESGRYWLAIDDRIYVFSHYPLYRIAAWSVYQAPGRIDAMAVHEGRAYLRCGDTVYLYGGLSGEQYDASKVTVQLPFLHNERPATAKSVYGFDVDCEGLWDVEILTDPKDLSQSLPVAKGIAEITYGDGNIGVALERTHFAPRLTCETDGYARLSSIAIHIVKTKEE